MESSESIATSGQGPQTAGNNISELLEFEGPPAHFLARLLLTQCQLAEAPYGVIIRLAASDRLETLAAYPGPEADSGFLQWVSRVEKSIRRTMKSGEAMVARDDSLSEAGTQSQRYSVILPMQHQGKTPAATAFRIKADTHHQLMLTVTRLEMTTFLLSHHELRLTMKMQNESMHRLRRVLEMVEAVNRPRRFMSAAMAFCNEITARFGCSRASLGFLDNRCVKARAISHTDTFKREMSVVQAIEAAMEECLDQDTEVFYPAADTAMAVNQAAVKLSKIHGPAAVLSLPIRDEGSVVAVLTIERSPDKPFSRVEEIETLRLICDLCAPRLLDLHRNDRWLGAQIALRAQRTMGLILGHHYIWIKALAIFTFLLTAFLATAKGDHRIKTSFAFQARNRQAVVAPFDTFTKSVLVEPGEKVKDGKTILGRLETSERRLKLAVLKAERLGYQKQMVTSMRDRKTAQAQIAQARIDKVDAQIRLIESQIEKAALVAPITGWVVSEDLKRQIGAPVETGTILFEIAGIDSLRAELHVPASSISNVVTGQKGELATVGHPDQKVGFVVERIHPTAEVVNHQNVFKVRARLQQQLEWMRPGMEGEARIFAGKRTYLWIATHRMINWLRIKLWV